MISFEFINNKMAQLACENLYQVNLDDLDKEKICSQQKITQPEIFIEVIKKIVKLLSREKSGSFFFYELRINSLNVIGNCLEGIALLRSKYQIQEIFKDTFLEIALIVQKINATRSLARITQGCEEEVCEKDLPLRMFYKKEDRPCKDFKVREIKVILENLSQDRFSYLNQTCPLNHA